MYKKKNLKLQWLPIINLQVLETSIAEWAQNAF